MVERIRQLIEYAGLSSSQFADGIEVPRAILSHILSGRNKPSLDVILKVLSNYRTINPDWLLLGEGDMLTKIATPANTVIPETIAEPVTKFDEIAGEVINGKVQNEVTAETVKLPALKEDKVVKQIVFFYTDNTFSVFNPEV
ncbi:helix-turn-helix domain-containing protein [Pontibacter populi]|uniref:Helix-turn-helix transcriptional regulator n=1 Tax=Pontibacter populi TaxID=890055 RepID=A0ABV1RYY1_9BACT